MTGAPRRPVLVYDGDCGFCSTAARFAQRVLGPVRVEPWQFLDLESLGLTAEQCERAVQWVAEDGTVHPAELGVIAALRHAGGAWRVMAVLLALPGVRHTSAVVYRVIARYRHRLPGGTAACRMPR